MPEKKGLETIQYNYFPGRLRFRDPVLRDAEIRNAALEAVKLICPAAEITYKESTASILAIYSPDSVQPEKLKPLVRLNGDFFIGKEIVDGRERLGYARKADDSAHTSVSGMN